MKTGFTAGDLLLIKFGNNDQGYRVPLDTYKNCLKTYINEARSAGVYPILVTPGRRNAWTDDGALYDEKSRVLQLTLGEYAQAIRDVATEMGVCIQKVVLLNAKYNFQFANSFIIS